MARVKKVFRVGNPSWNSGSYTPKNPGPFCSLHDDRVEVSRRKKGSRGWPLLWFVKQNKKKRKTQKLFEEHEKPTWRQTATQ